MKLRNLCLLITFAVTITHQTQPYTAGLLYGSGAALCAASSYWAHRKVKTLEALSDQEKNKSEIKTALVRWKAVRAACSTLGTELAVLSIGTLYREYERRKRDDRINRAQQEQAERENQERFDRENRLREDQEVRDRLARERQADEQRRREEQERAQQQAREQEECTRKAAAFHRKQAKERDAKIAPFINAAKEGDLNKVQTIVDQQPTDAERDILLQARDKNGHTAWHYAKKRGHRPLIQYALEQAARLAGNECPVCTKEIEDPSLYTVGSVSFDCLHFCCVGCIQQWHRGFSYETNVDGHNLVNYVPGKPECPVCQQP